MAVKLSPYLNQILIDYANTSTCWFVIVRWFNQCSEGPISSCFNVLIV